ncbi:hypothetical protein [Gordonia polyisoprenivorans]|uniref:hypothetical protein n=1 Tax=Gordonia polyisoprenivorans TaxID=84595 RepID=UPI001AD771F0|nr:hypothetical protein [Gordonia polyisoprenivorans]QTI66872.1 hypothetical protein J6U32_14455 [Gordonia polyisoprenivorans]
MAPLLGAVATWAVAWVARDVCDITAATITALIITARRSLTKTAAPIELPCPTEQLVRS